ncbi:two-component system sensor histidine kinase NtrB [Arenimonas fontis]|uniref:histidine kinase n=1 Tax=Arenimonas fontis TaxID=2608255 RepID=A0A5B2ZBV4_9GAMM|nr:ATP-binding protein [Arenimonas fontis]KAA2284760.1 PAS domain-containing protein [Arenimonas fontis]
MPDRPDPPALDTLSTPVAWADAEGRLLGCNPAFASWLGVSARRLQGLAVTELDAEGGRLADLLVRLPDTGEAVRVRRARLAMPGGGERFAELLLARDEHGGLRLEAHPSEEFPGEDPATALPAALHAALKGLAHEVRNPLAGLKGAAQLLARRVENGDARQLVELIGSEADRLAALVERLLHPTPPRPFAPTNIHAVLERVRQLAETEAGWSVKLSRDFDPSLPDIRGDADRLVQAVWNLVRNALESGASNVSLRTRAEHHIVIGENVHRLAVRVEVADDGRGVPEDLAERIFLPLVTGRAEGTGLGLPLAQQIAREHGGSLGYRSRPGHTVFTLLLPVPPAGDEGAAGGGAG